jgi:hypothetical protein
VFKNGQNWKPTITQPIEPKLSAYLNKGNNNESKYVKSLQRPVSPMIKSDND